MVKVYTPYELDHVQIGDFTYIGPHTSISHASIGKFCSIGPSCIIGRGIHPTHGVSTAPMFYSTAKQNGFSLCSVNKVEERKSIVIGNDVFIGMRAVILDGCNIGDGAVIGAGAVVTKNVPPYAIVVGNPGKVIKFRFPDQTVEKLKSIQWWNWDLKDLEAIERMEFDVENFISLDKDCRKVPREN